MITNKTHFPTVLMELHVVLLNHRKKSKEDKFVYKHIDFTFETEKVLLEFIEVLKEDEVLSKYAFFDLYPTTFPGVFRVKMFRHTGSHVPKFVKRQKFEIYNNARGKLQTLREINAIQDAAVFKQRAEDFQTKEICEIILGPGSFDRAVSSQSPPESAPPPKKNEKSKKRSVDDEDYKTEKKKKQK